MNRRTVLKSLLGAGALTLVDGAISPVFRRLAHAAPPTTAYSTIFIHLWGGLDPVMHWDARTGFVNRDVAAGDVRTTAAGVRWYEPVLAPLAAHMEDAVVIRNLLGSFGHEQGSALLWYGTGNATDAAAATPWTNYLASQLLLARRVPAANLVTYQNDDDDPFVNFTSYNNRSPDALAAAQRVTGISGFTDGLDVLAGQPSPALQGRVFQHVARMKQRLYSPTVQARATAQFAAADQQADDLLTQPIPPVWPPDAATLAAFNLSASDLTTVVSDGNQRFKTHLALAYQAARQRISHVVYLQSTQGGYDTHNSHDAGQRARSLSYMADLGRLLTALKSTPSPVVDGLTMFDTTHVVVTSELGRANQADLGDDNDPTDGLGTPHWDFTSAILFGGRFKRGYAFGDRDATFKGVPADLTTGALGSGVNPTMKHLAATILKANDVDPAPWTTALPIDAVLRGGV